MNDTTKPTQEEIEKCAHEVYLLFPTQYGMSAHVCKCIALWHLTHLSTITKERDELNKKAISDLDLCIRLQQERDELRGEVIRLEKRSTDLVTLQNSLGICIGGEDCMDEGCASCIAGVPNTLDQLRAEVDRLSKMANDLTKDVDHHSGINEKYEEEVKHLLTQLELYTKELSSGLCSIHKEPEPLTCSVCNKIKWLDSANKERIKQLEIEQSKVARCVEFAELVKKLTFGDLSNEADKLLSSLPTTPNLVARVRELEALAKSMEWSASFRDGQGHSHKCCPKCLAFMEDGHLADCKLQQTLNNQK